MRSNCGSESASHIESNGRDAHVGDFEGLLPRVETMGICECGVEVHTTESWLGERRKGKENLLESKWS